MARTQVQSELIATNAISGTIIADNAITATHIATNSISGTLVQDSGIVTTMIAANNVTAAKIVTDAIQTRHIADDQVTQAKIAVNSVGISELAVTDGSNGQMLTTNGSGTLSFSTPSSFDADAAQVFNESGAAVDFRIEGDTEQNLFFVDGSADKIGIGTNGPVYGLDVRNTIYSAVAATTKNLTLGDTTNGTTSAISTNNNNMLFYHNGSTESMRISSDGDVGIGMTPVTNSRLTVKTQGDGTYPIRVVNSADSDLLFGVYESSDGDGNNGMVYINDGGGNTDVKLSTNGHSWFKGGNVGIGTDSPANNLHIHTDSGSEGLTIKSTGDTSNAIIIDANRSSSGAAINQLLGKWNGTDVCEIRFVTGDDTTNKDDGYISFYASAADNLAERMRVTRNNGVYFGDIPSFANNTYAHAGVFSKNSTPNGTVVMEDSDVSSGIGNTVLFLYLRDSDPANFANYIIFRDGDAQVGAITHNDDGGGVTYGSSSDYRLKENVNYDWNATTLLKQLKPAKFNFKRNPSKTIQGLLAHEVADIVPSSVRGDKDHMEPIGTIKDSKGNIVSEKVYEHFCKTDEGQTWTKTGTEPVYQQLDYSRLVPLLTKSLQEQQTIIDDLKSRIETLES